ncbi:hypothetical protein D9M68_369650 [compost metagenome]
MITLQGVDQLGVDANTPGRPSGTAFQHVANAEFACDAAHILMPALVGENRIAGDDEQPAGPGEVGDQVFGQAVDEDLLLRLVAHIGEGKDGDGGLDGQRQGGLGAAALAQGRRADAIERNRLDYVLDRVGAKRVEIAKEAPPHLVVYVAGDVDFAGTSHGLKPRGDNDAVAVKIAAFDDNIAEIDADAQKNSAVVGKALIGCCHALLNIDRTGDRIHGTGKLHQHTIAHRLDDAAVVLADKGIENLLAAFFQRRKCTAFVQFDEPAVTDDIRSHDSGETPLSAFFSHIAPLRRMGCTEL